MAKSQDRHDRSLGMDACISRRDFLNSTLIASGALLGARLHVPLKWLVASLVCDTFETFAVPITITEPTPRRSLHVA